MIAASSARSIFMGEAALGMGSATNRPELAIAATRIPGVRERIAIGDPLQVIGKAHRKPLELATGSARTTP